MSTLPYQVSNELKINSAKVVLSQITFAGLACIKVTLRTEIEACAGSAIGMKTDVLAVITEVEREGIVFIDSNGTRNDICLDGQLW